ncbi:MAG: TIGR00730 family Rossman fold protein [Lachnospiraceae bacterium]|nr:TIGR00730 family Rossman fold protein [Lachnospiraceae bacterium]
MNITVYIGASAGRDPLYREKARELGLWIGENGHRLIYGGSKMGLMGIIADAVLEAKGEVIGVEPRFFVEQEAQHEGITQLVVTETMAERKQAMLDLGRMYIAFPGGTGTLEEMAEAVTQTKLGFSDKPCAFYNVNGYYNDLKAQFIKMIDLGFLRKEDVEKVYFPETINDISRIAAQC